MKKKYKLEPKEQMILESFENDEFVSVLNSERKKELIETAKNTTKKSRRINIRLSERDFERINIKAIEENIPYQTLIGSVIHKYLDGRFFEKH